MLFKSLTKLAPALAIVAAFSLGAPAAFAEKGEGVQLFGKKRKAGATTIKPATALSGSKGTAATKTEVLAGKGVKPVLGPTSTAALQHAIDQYEAIAARGGWQVVPGKKLKEGSEGKDVAALKRRLHAEGYVNDAAIAGEQGGIFTSGTEAALKVFQANHGLAQTGRVDAATLAALNVPVAGRLATLRANLARAGAYTAELGPRYIVVNIPALQLEAVSNGRVFSRHNIIVGKPERPSPVVMTELSNLVFNPYWNVPVSIVEKDLIPQIRKNGAGTLRDQNIRVFDGYGGRELDPDDIDWDNAPPDRYHLRQDPGEKNAMATVKINFPSPFGVYMHDTPLRSLFSTGERLVSSGCVRVDKVPILVNWILNGQDGWNAGRIEAASSSGIQEEIALADPPQIRWVYLTAWASEDGQVQFRPDIYDMDGSGFVTGQPLAPGEYSETGQRFVAKAPPREIKSAGQVRSEEGFDPLPDEDGAASFWRKKRIKAQNVSVDDDGPTFVFKRNNFAAKPVKKAAAKPKKTETAKAKLKPRQEVTRSVIVGFNDDPKPTLKKKRKTAALAAVDAKAVKKKKKTAEDETLKKKKKKKPQTFAAGGDGPVFGQD